MDTSWNTIEENINSSHGQIQKIVNQGKVSQFFHNNKKSIGAAVFSIAILGLSFFSTLESQNFKAEMDPLVSMFNEEISEVDETEEFIVNTNISSESQEVIPVVLSEPEVIVEDYVENFEVLSDDDVLSEIEDMIAEEGAIEPQLELVQNNTVTNYLENNVSVPVQFIDDIDIEISDNMAQLIENSVNVQELNNNNSLQNDFIVPATNIVDSIIKENIYTNDNIIEEDVLHSSSDIEIISEDKEQDEFHFVADSKNKIYRGILKAGNGSTGGYVHAYYLVLKDGYEMKLTTNRDLNSVIGKKLDIEIEGTKESFILHHVYYNEGGRTLPKSGPEMLFLLIGLIAVIGAFGVRKIKR